MNGSLQHPSDDAFVGEPPNAVVKTTFFECFEAIVSELTGEAGPQIAAFRPAHSIKDGFYKLPPSEHVTLLDRAARRLQCPDFGLRLAALECSRREDNAFLLAMQNSETLGDALQWAAARSRSFGGIYTQSYRLPKNAQWATFEYGISCARASHSVAQAVEYALATLYHRIMGLSQQQARCEIWFSHPPMSSSMVYRKHIRSLIRFNQPVNAILISRDDVCRPIESRNSVIFDIATYYIDQNYTERTSRVSADAGRVVLRLLGHGRCTLESLAAELGLQPRTLQRRLKQEGLNFFELKESAQRRLALYYLGDVTVPIKNIAERLGYAGTPAFTRSCRRWFSSSPRSVRRKLAVGEGPQP